MVHKQEGCFLYVCTKFKADCTICSKVLKGPKISKFGHVTQATPTLGSFCGPDAVGYILYVCAKFEADISIRSKVIRGSQNFGISSRDLGHAHFGWFYDPYAVGVRPLCLCQI